MEIGTRRARDDRHGSSIDPPRRDFAAALLTTTSVINRAIYRNQSAARSSLGDIQAFHKAWRLSIKIYFVRDLLSRLGGEAIREASVSFRERKSIVFDEFLKL